MAAEKAWGIVMKRACVSRHGGGEAEGEVVAWRLEARRKLVKERSTSKWSHSALPRARYLTIQPSPREHTKKSEVETTDITQKIITNLKGLWGTSSHFH
jgi:hypothetical protein